MVIKTLSRATDVRRAAIDEAIQLAKDYAAGLLKPTDKQHPLDPSILLEARMADIVGKLRPVRKMRGEIVVSFETVAGFKGRYLCLEVGPRTITLWPKGRRRQRTVLDIASEYDHGLLNDARLGRL